MNYIYHWVPDNMQGDTLYPLNQLKDMYPEIYSKQASKYEGREHIMEQRIPILDCLWNDVLHLSPVHPLKVKQGLIEAGRTDLLDMDFFEIDPHILDPKNAIVYLNADRRIMGKMQEVNFAPFNPDTIAHYSAMPQETLDYYKETIKEGNRPFFFVQIPHILYKGSINTSGIKKISW